MEVIFKAFLFCAVFCALCIPILIPLLRKIKFGQYVRDDGPESHKSKTGTPTMGGVVFFAALIIVAVIYGHSDNNLYAVILVTICFGLIGFADDFKKIVLKRTLGLKAREKIAAQLIIAGIFVLYMIFLGDRGTEVFIPILGKWFDMGALYIPFAILVMVSSNAVNLTDGLDGLAAGVVFFVALSYILIANSAGFNQMSIFAACLAGCCLGFLFHNLYPAKIFMGDTGAFILGGALCALAITTKTELFLLLSGMVFVLEALSVIIQVIYFRFTGGKRILRMAPLHHHFELSGWTEKQVVFLFWLFGAAAAAISVIVFI